MPRPYLYGPAGGPSPRAMGRRQDAGATTQPGRVWDPPLPGPAPSTIRDSPFAVVVVQRQGAAPCAPTISAGYSARVWNRLRPPRYVAAGRVENPPLPGSHHSPFASRHLPSLTIGSRAVGVHKRLLYQRERPSPGASRRPLPEGEGTSDPFPSGRGVGVRAIPAPFAIRHSLFAVSFHSPFAVFSARRSPLAVFFHSLVAIRYSPFLSIRHSLFAVFSFAVRAVSLLTRGGRAGYAPLLCTRRGGMLARVGAIGGICGSLPLLRLRRSCLRRRRLFERRKKRVAVRSWRQRARRVGAARISPAPTATDCARWRRFSAASTATSEVNAACSVPYPQPRQCPRQRQLPQPPGPQFPLPQRQ
jgi:hypothetical protein